MVDDGNAVGPNDAAPNTVALPKLIDCVEKLVDTLETAEATQRETHKELTRLQVVGAAAGVGLVLSQFTNEMATGPEVLYGAAVVAYAVSLFSALWSMDLITNAYNTYRISVSELAVAIQQGEFVLTNAECASLNMPEAIHARREEAFEKLNNAHRLSSHFHGASFWLLVIGSVAAMAGFICLRFGS
ncbi:hypothetical protein [Maricaulis sp. MIT060901]|uniref:hypothetical protein n=1 Tax=Maricaulis sp. MIT060901 TaxID=3096993 RepID=UPI00399A4B40